MMEDGLEGFHSPVKHRQSSPEIIASPMWISPNDNTVQVASTTEAFMAAETYALPHVPCLAPNASFDSAVVEANTEELGDIPAIICIPNNAVPQTDLVLVAAAVNVATNERSSEMIMDEVSELNDNPDDDDMNLLPHATHDVLANIFDEIYKDESEVEDADEEEEYVDDEYLELMSK